MAAKTQAVTAWDKALAEAAAKAANKEAASASVGQFFSIRGGQLTWGGAAIPNNQMACIVLAGVIERVYYEGMYDPQNPTSPTCYAFGEDPSKMTPHEQSTTKQNDTCDGCPKNEWGTSVRGKGKACREIRRLCLLSAGTYERDGKYKPPVNVDELKSAPVGFMRVPTTSIRAYSGWVIGLNDAAKLPPWAVVCRINVAADPVNQVSVAFTTEYKLPTTLLPAVQERIDAAERSLVVPYPKATDRAKPVARGVTGARKF